ncbi:MAG: hypothetical protein ACE5FM_02040 [Methyloligellaceae bacterium]
MTWLKFLGPAVQVLAAIMRLFTGRRQRRIGRLEAEHAQAVQDHEMLRKAADARRSVRDDADGLRDDPHNRDAH